MKLADIELGTAEYIQQEIASKATGPLKFLIYTGTFLGASMLEKNVQKYSGLLKQMEVLNDQGDIDIDKLYNAAKQGIQKSGSFEYKGIIFSENDIDKLYSFIKRRG